MLVIVVSVSIHDMDCGSLYGDVSLELTECLGKLSGIDGCKREFAGEKCGNGGLKIVKVCQCFNKGGKVMESFGCEIGCLM